MSKADSIAARGRGAALPDQEVQGELGKLALVIGCARSGTSILGELLAAHPDVNYIWEAHHIWELGGHGADGCQRLTEREATPLVKAQIRQWFRKQLVPGKTTIEKNPRNVLRVPYIREILPEATLIHMVRDGRDVACSLVPGCGEDVWYHLKPPSWRRFFTEYDGAVRCAHAWSEILEIALADLEGVPHLQIRYEDLVASPRTVARSVLAHLGLVETPSAMELCGRIQDSTAGSYHAQGQVAWYRDNHRTRVGRWHENLAPEEKTAVDQLLGPLLTRLGYMV